MLNDIETERENAERRISKNGPGAELVRKWVLERLQKRMDPFYAHAVIADLVALEAALALREDVDGRGGRATLVEAFILLLESCGDHRVADDAASAR